MCQVFINYHYCIRRVNNLRFLSSSPEIKISKLIRWSRATGRELDRRLVHFSSGCLGATTLVLKRIWHCAATLSGDPYNGMAWRECVSERQMSTLTDIV